MGTPESIAKAPHSKTALWGLGTQKGKVYHVQLTVCFYFNIEFYI